MGDNLEALRAGATPKTIPTIVETPKARITEFRVTFAGKILSIPMAPSEPNIMPMPPPRQDKIMASIKNCNKIALG